MDFQNYYPHVTVTYEQIADFTTGFPVRCASGESLDLFFVNSMDYEVSFKNAISRYGVDISTIQGIDLSAVDAAALAAGVQDGRQVLLPVYYQTTGLIVNTTLLKKYGLEVPTTAAQLTAACDTLLANGVTPIYGGASLRSKLFLGDAVYRLMKAENQADIVAGMEQGVLDAGILQTAVSTWQSWQDKGYFNPEADTLKDTYNAAILRFFEGDIPFLIGTSDTISGCKKRESKSEAFTASPFEYTYIIPSVTEDEESALLCCQMFFGVYSGSQNLTYAQEFLRFMATRAELQVMATVKGMPSVTASTGDSRFTYVDALPEDRLIYSSQVPCDVHTLSCLSGTFNQACDDMSVEWLTDTFAQKMAVQN